MSSGVITISRRKYAAGLFWQPLAGKGLVRENARKISRDAKLGASLYVVFGGMIGLGGRRGGASGGMPVAAAEVMESFSEETFLSAFSVKEGWWLLAVRGGIIVRDKVFADAGAAQKEYAELYKMPDWGVLVAPSDWSAPSSVERRLADFVSGNKKYRLSSISHLPGYIMTLAILAAAIFAGYSFFEQPIRKLFEPRPRQASIDPAVAEEYKRKLAEIDAPKTPPAPKVIHVPMPYEALPALGAKADQCWRAIAFLSQQITGWNVESVSCGNGEANAHLLRSFGTIGDLYTEVSQKMPNTAITETGGSDVILTAKLKALDMAPQIPEYSADEIMTAVQSVFQRINEDINFQRDFKELSVPELGPNEVLDTEATDLPVVKIEAASKLQPLEFIKIMEDITSVGMDSVKWDNRQRTWNYEVVIYVR